MKLLNVGNRSCLLTFVSKTCVLNQLKSEQCYVFVDCFSFRLTETNLCFLAHVHCYSKGK